jgi:hypothetical protein
MHWLIQERELLDGAVEKSLGMLSGVQWLLRTGRSNPANPSVSDEDVANMLDLVKQQLTAAVGSIDPTP